MKVTQIATWACILSFVAPSFTWAAPQSKADLNFKGWVGTPMTTVHRAEGDYRIRVLQRYANSADNPYLIGSLTYIHAPKTDETRQSPGVEASLEFLRKVMKAKGWAVRKQGNAKIYQGYWAMANRAVRIYVQENKKEISYSVAMFRPAYWNSVGFETDLMQAHMAGVFGKKSPFLDRFMASLEKFGIQKAYADFDPCSGYAGEELIACQSALAQYIETGVIPPEANGVTTPPPPTTPTAPTVPTDPGTPDIPDSTAPTTTTPPAGNTTPPAPTTPPATQPTTQQPPQVPPPTQPTQPTQTTQTTTVPSDPLGIKGVADEFNAPVKQAAAGIEKVGNAAEKLTDVDFWVTATLSVLTTGIVFTAITSGLDSLGKYLHELFTGAKDKAKRYKTFQDALETYAKLEKDKENLEKETDEALYFVNAAEMAGGREKLFSLLRTEVAKDQWAMQDIKDRLTEARKSGVSRDDECVQQDFAELGRIQDRMGDLEDAMKALKKPKAFDEICNKMKENIRKLLQAENAMQQARAALRDGVDEWARHWVKKHQDTIESSDRIADRLEKADKLSAKGTEKAEQLLVDQLTDDVRAAYDECMHQQAPFWSRIPGLGYLVTKKDRAFCRDMVESIDSQEGRKFIARKTDIEAGKLQSNRKIFDKLRENAKNMRPSSEMNQRAKKGFEEWIADLAEKDDPEQIRKVMKKYDLREDALQKVCR